MIEIKNLKFEGRHRTIFQNLNMTINDGEVVGIIGPSGCGKSLLLRLMIELNKADSGEILFDGKALERNKSGALADNSKIGMVFQNYNLFDNMTVLENVASGPMHLTKKDNAEVLENTKNIIKKLGLNDVAYAYPHVLSGGQKQRVAIARTLAMNPEIILFDEPTASLDPMMKGEVEAVIRMLAAQKRTMVIVSHEMELIRSVCTRVIFLKDGIVFEDGKPSEIFEHPKKVDTRRFVHQLRSLEFDVDSKNFDFIGNNTKINDFAFRNGISSHLKDRLAAILEELFQMVIIQPMDENRMKIAFEYNRKEQALVGDVQFTGPYIDPDDPMFFFSWPIIERRASEVNVKQLEDDLDGFTNDVRIIIREELKDK
ncbi:MAG: amino acid ABC transporter ATP-binding protein [Clostridiales bacterium]|nr:amino acid ABC transporter ATP-binding protein [Candidatus Crickella equi]